MLGIPIERIGQTYKLPIDLESQDGPDLSCHCERCEYKKDNEGKVSTNFYYGVLVFPLWIMNVFLYLKSWTLDDQFEFSQQVQEEHRDEITLLQPESITSRTDPDNLVGQLVMRHELQQSRFDKWVHWSVMGLFVDLILIWFIVMIMTSSHN